MVRPDSRQCNQIPDFMAKQTEDPRAVLAARTRQRREALGLTREQVAEIAGVSSGYVRDIELAAGAEFGPGVLALARVATALQTTIDALIGAEPRTLDGFGMVDDAKVKTLLAAKCYDDLKPLWWPGKYRYGIEFTASDRIVPAEELRAIETRCNAHLAVIQALEKEREDRRRKK